MAFVLPPLPYAFAALEPHIDAQTMEIHHDRHHATYVNNLNGAIEKHPELGSRTVEELLSDLQASLFRDALDERERRTLRDPSGYDEMIEYLRDAAGFVAAPWCGRRQCEARVKDDSSATIRCLPLSEPPLESGACVCCGRPAASVAFWAQAY